MTKTNGKTKKEEMLAYMKDKYGEEFEFVNINTEVWSVKYTEMIVHSPSFPNARIVVHCDDKTGNMSDNYVSLLLSKDIESTFSDIVRHVYGANVVVNEFKPVVLPENFNRETTVDEYARDIYSGLDLSIFLEGQVSNREADLEKFRAELAEKQYPISFRIYYLRLGVLEKVNSQNYMSFLKDNSKDILLRGEFILSKSFDFSIKKWGEVNE